MNRALHFSAFENAHDNRTRVWHNPLMIDLISKFGSDMRARVMPMCAVKCVCQSLGNFSKVLFSIKHSSDISLKIIHSIFLLLLGSRAKSPISSHKMSWLRPRDGRERREQRGIERLDTCYDSGNNQRICQSSDKGMECRMDVPVREVIYGTRPMYPVHGQQKLPFVPPRNPSIDWQERRRLPLERDSSPGGQEERLVPPQRRSSPGWQEERRVPQANPSRGWHDERPLADSDTLPARWRNTRPATKETWDHNQGQPTSKDTKVHFSRPVARRQRTPEDDYEEEESGSSSVSSLGSASSLGGSIAIVEKGESKPDDRSLNLSYCFDLIEDEGAESGDEDGFVHVSRRLRRIRSLSSPYGRRD